SRQVRLRQVRRRPPQHLVLLLQHSVTALELAGPAHRRHHAALVIGADSRQQFDDILKSTEVAAVIDRQERHITAAHAYTVDRTVPGIRMKP
ncbi:hypothetical protein SAMN06296429_1101, partial [Janibacter indicus]